MPSFTPQWMSEHFTTTTKAAYPAKNPAYGADKTYKPNHTAFQSGQFYGTTTMNADYVPQHPGPPVPQRPAPLPPAFKTTFVPATTQNQSFKAPPFAPTKSYAPQRSYQPNYMATGKTTNNEFYRVFQSPNVGSAAKIPSPSAFNPKFDMRTTTNQAYVPKPYSPTKTYAPNNSYQPNNAPLGTTTSRAEIVAPWFNQ